MNSVAPMIQNRLQTRLVIDTNVLLDLFVFNDPRWQGLLAALEDGSVDAFTRADCCREWQIVLGYAHLPLDDTSRAIAQQRFARLIQTWHGDPLPIALPVCKDRDDQKFLELARDAGADVLVTKDKALLKLARQTKKRDLFRIVTPDQWQASALVDDRPA